MAETHTELPVADIALLDALEPTAERLLENHLANRRVWYPDELIPYDEARSYKADDVFDEKASGLPDEARSALLVNLLTEDNLYYYFETINRMLGISPVYKEWSRTWTAEEGRHSLAIRGIILAKRLLPHRFLEDARVAQVDKGETPQPKTTVATFIYTKLQERATKISHRNTGAFISRVSKGRHADVSKVTGFVAGDEGMHEEFYDGLATGASEVDPSAFVIAADEEIRTFAMPGTGIEGFIEHSKKIAKAGILDRFIVKEQIFDPAIEAWDIENLLGLSGAAEVARESLFDYIARLAKTIEWSRERRAAKVELQGV